MTLTPEFVLAAVGSLVAVILWLARLEAKTNRANERLDDFKTQCGLEFTRLDRDFREWRGGPMHIDRLPSREERP